MKTQAKDQPIDLSYIWSVEAAARELEDSGIAPAQAYAYAAVIWRVNDLRFDYHAARDELRRAGYTSQVSNVIMNTLGEVRRGLGLESWEPI